MLTKLPNPAHQAIAVFQHNAAEQNRELMLTKLPNPAHQAIAAKQNR